MVNQQGIWDFQAEPAWHGLFADTALVHGYFENAHGEQLIFVYDHATQRGTLWCGDAGWEQPYPVVDGRVQPAQPDAPDGRISSTAASTIRSAESLTLVLSEAEQTWLRACWAAATAFER